MIAPSVDLQTKPPSTGFIPFRQEDSLDPPNKSVPVRSRAEENQRQYGNSTIANAAEQGQGADPALNERGNLPSQAPQPTLPNSSATQYLAPTADPTSSETIFASFSRSTATDVATQLGWLGDKVSSQFNVDRTQFSESAPSIAVTLDGSVPKADEGQANELASLTMPSADSIVLEPAPPRQELDAAVTNVPPQPADDSVSTEIGPGPQFQRDGESNPDRMNSVAIQSRRIAGEASRSVSESIQGNQAASRIVAEPLHREEELAVETTKSSIATSQSAEMAEYLLTEVGSDTRAIADSDFAPALEATLAAPREQVQQAVLTRDDSRQQALLSAQQQADEASVAAAHEQQQSIAQGHALVEQEKQAGIAEQRAEFERFEGEVTSSHQSHQADIERTVDSEQARANQAIGDGKKQAEEEQAAAQRRADEEKQKAEADKPQEERNWWGKLTSWFKNAIREWTDKLVGAIKKVFDAAKSAVNTVLTAAKNLAVGIIKALRETVAGLIQAFAAGLKLMVSALLVAFPKIREKVNAAIDGVVAKAIEMVDAIAKRLEDTVVSIVDGLQATINKALDLFELVIVTQIQIAGALLSGDFMEAAMILFRAACKSVGIPADEFIGILRDARDAFLDIIKRPAKFLGYLISTVGQGMKVFFANFPQRMIAGLTGWLFGMVASAGVTLPKSFDLKSIFMLLLQVMGITYEYIRAKVVAIVGERTVERIEQIMTPIRILFTEGPGALWQWIGDQVSAIKDKIVEEVSQWVVTQVIQQAMIKLASMFMPVGAFVQAVLMMYNTVMFFVSKIAEIFAWVKSITSSLKTIAVGAIAAAANYIDQAMSKSIPLIIDFLARLVGINGIGEKIRSIVTKLRAPIDKGITFVVTKIIELAKKAWGGIKAGANTVKQTVSDWWTAKEEFRDEKGDTHRLYFEMQTEEASPRLMIASDPTDFEEHLRKLKASGRTKEHDELEPCYVPIRNAQATIKPGSKNDKPIENVPVHLNRLAKKLDRKESTNDSMQVFATGVGLSIQELHVCMQETGIDEKDVLSLAADMTPYVGTGKSLVELLTGEDPITGEEASRWWALVGLIPFGKAVSKVDDMVDIYRKIRSWVLRRLKSGNSLASTTAKWIRKPHFSFGQVSVLKNGVEHQVQFAKGNLGVPGTIASPRKTAPGAEKKMREAVSRGTGDDAGHLIASQFGGPIVRQNYSRQNWIQNRGGGTYWDLENRWANKLLDGVDVSVEVRDYTPIGRDRPTHRIVTWSENGVEQPTLFFANTETVKSRAARGYEPPATAQNADVIDIFTKHKRSSAEIVVSNGSAGAMRRLEYDGDVRSETGKPHHGKKRIGRKSPGPKDGQAALDMSIQVKATSNQRVGIDYTAKEIVVFMKHNDVYHGFVTKWNELHTDARNALIDHGMVDRKGNIL